MTDTPPPPEASGVAPNPEPLAPEASVQLSGWRLRLAWAGLALLVAWGVAANVRARRASPRPLLFTSVHSQHRSRRLPSVRRIILSQLCLPGIQPQADDGQRLSLMGTRRVTALSPPRPTGQRAAAGDAHPPSTPQHTSAQPARA